MCLRVCVCVYAHVHMCKYIYKCMHAMRPGNRHDRHMRMRVCEYFIRSQQAQTSSCSVHAMYVCRYDPTQNVQTLARRRLVGLPLSCYLSLPACVPLSLPSSFSIPLFLSLSLSLSLSAHARDCGADVWGGSVRTQGGLRLHTSLECLCMNLRTYVSMHIYSHIRI